MGSLQDRRLIVDHKAIVFARVKNRLNNNGEVTSIHWHGMYQRETPWMDGVGGITQQSIGDGNDFDYIFEASPFGTHWYHSHVGEQRVNGMFAALVVRSPFPINSSELVPEENGNAIIIDRPQANTFLIGDRNQLSPIEALCITAGTYAIVRVIGAQESTPFDYSIDGHTLRVIATDGKDVAFRNAPMDVDFVSVHPGERYDILVPAIATVGNYWMRAESQQVNVPEGMEFSARAILSYEGAESLDWRNGYSNVPEMPHREMCTPENPCSNLNCPSGVVPNRNCISLLELVPRPMKPASDLPKFPPTC